MRHPVLLLLAVPLLFLSCRDHTEGEISHKAEWIREFFDTVEEYPEIYALSYWHEDFDDTHFRLDSSTGSLEAFREMATRDCCLHTAVFEDGKLVAVEGKKYLSAFPGFCGEEDCVGNGAIQDYESLTGVPLAWVYFSDNWMDELGFPYGHVQTIVQAGRTPFIRMMARSDFEEQGIDPVWNLEQIISGQFDEALYQWFSEARDTGVPLLVEFGTEMNGSWFPWNGSYYGAGQTDGYGDSAYPDGPEIFRDAYRHLIDISRQAEANNITWFFHFDVSGDPPEAWNDPVYYYPGDDYIDCLGVITYGAFTPGEVSEELMPGYLLDKAYTAFTSISTSKPYAVLEFAVTEY